MKQRLEIKGNKAMFSGMAAKFKTMVEDEIAITTENIADGARRAVPVDTGFLRNSIISESKELEGLIQARAQYAPYVEFGTGGLVDVPSGMESYAKQFKGKGIKQVNLPPRPYLYPAFKLEITKMLERLDKKIKNGTKQGN